MNLQEFKQKYFTNNFYWVNKNNYKQLQEIALEVGCLCHTGKKDIINWHEGFKNLGFRTYEKNDNVTVFQKEPFLLHNQTASNFEEMLNDYENVATCAKTITMETICEECKGEKTIEVYNGCGYPASECCGGCTETIECTGCEGTGIMIEY